MSLIPAASRSLVVALLFALLVLFTCHAPAALAAAGDEGVIVALGDSLTAGYGLDERDAWPAQLERRLRAAGYRWRVVNAGMSGETSDGARARLSRVLELKPDVLVLATGANDGLRGLPPRELRENLDAMLATLAVRRVTVVLAGMQALLNLGAQYQQEFGRVYPELAHKHGAVFLPFLLEGVTGEAALNLDDNLHPNAAGHRAITDLMYPRLLEAIGRVRAARAR